MTSSEYAQYIKKRKQNRKICCDFSKLASAFIIDHRSGLYTFWHESLDALCIVSSFIYAHFAAQRHAPPVGSNMETAMLVIESIFLIDCLMTFIKNYKNPNDPQGEPIRKLSDIFINYTKGDLMYDLIALMPFNLIRMKRDRQYLLYCLKTIRLKRGFQNLDVMDYLNMYKSRVSASIEKKIKKQQKKAAQKKQTQKMGTSLADEMLFEDQTRLGDILKCSLLLKLIQILIILASTSFFFAMIFKFII